MPAKSGSPGQGKPSRSRARGDTRRVLLDVAIAIIDDAGASAVTLRELGSRAGVSHTAMLYHFGSLKGLFTALATDGFTMLRDQLAIVEDPEDPLASGIGYVTFALEHPQHFDVMFNPELFEPDDPGLVAAQMSVMTLLRERVEAREDPGSRADAAIAVLAGWSMMHGLAVLSQNGNLSASHLPDGLGNVELTDLARRIGAMLYGSPSS